MEAAAIFIRIVWINFIEEFEKQHIKVHFARDYMSNTFHRDSRLEKEALEKLQKAKKQNIPVLLLVD